MTAKNTILNSKFKFLHTVKGYEDLLHNLAKELAKQEKDLITRSESINGLDRYVVLPNLTTESHELLKLGLIYIKNNRQYLTGRGEFIYAILTRGQLE